MKSIANLEQWVCQYVAESDHDAFYTGIDEAVADARREAPETGSEEAAKYAAKLADILNEKSGQYALEVLLAKALSATSEVGDMRFRDGELVHYSKGREIVQALTKAAGEATAGSFASYGRTQTNDACFRRRLAWRMAWLCDRFDVKYSGAESGPLHTLLRYVTGAEDFSRRICQGGVDEYNEAVRVGRER